MISFPAPRPERPIGLIGLGLVGSALLERLGAGGWQMLGWDIDPSRHEELVSAGAHQAKAAADVFARCRCVLLSLPSHREVNAVLGEAEDALAAGTVVIDTTTGDPASTEAVAAQLADRGITYLDATISGSSAQLRAGHAALMVGGAPEAYAACSDLLACLGAPIFHTGPVGTGARMKLVTNLVLGLNRAALAEGLALAQSLGLDLEMTLEVMRGGAAYSKIMDTKGGRMIRGDFAPEARLSQHLKDVRLIVETGRQAGLPMTLSTAHQDVLEAAESAGCGELDNSAIITVLRRANHGRPA
jgi:3-hydroxyisobutyrate dehydrogenase-like beta-hydroxyacid dehydrogenase